ncbi:MAG TPA: sulfotransferase [Rhizomicrobium sp.]|jgi:tetratricopeptide (TPR) repeat protein|nr:sulfotransferase [Rhizomicrobium sp.]
MQPEISIPQTLPLLLQDVQSAVQADQLPRAIELAREGLERGLVHPLLLHLRAHWLSDRGRYGEALRDLEEAQRLAPSDPRIQNGIGECLVKDERFADAVGAFDRAIALWPEFPLAYQNRGFALETLGEHKLAEEAYRRAAALDPSFADPLARLAGLAAARADWNEARKFSVRALALDAGNAIANFAAAKADLAEARVDDAEARLQFVLADPTKDVLEHASALKQLGDVRDAQKRTDEAFETYRAANEEFRAFFEPRLKARGTESTPALISRLVKHLAQDGLPHRQSDSEATGEAVGLVFLAGFPRSGTTLLGQILAAHPDVTTLEERFPIVQADRDFLRAPGGLDRLSKATEAELKPYRESYWNYVHGFGVHVRDKVIIDKLPMHTFRLPLIAQLFPQAKILFAVRDPRDVLFSAFRRSFVIHAFTYELLELESAARLYDSMMQVREMSRSKLDLSWLDVRNEDVVTAFEPQMRSVCEFLGLPWNPLLKRFADSTKNRNIGTPSSAQVRSGLNGEGVGQWRRYRQYLAPVLPILQPWVEKFGYSPE